MPRGEDAKRQSLLRFELFKKIDKFLSLNFRNILISPLEGEKKFLSELCELRNFREGYNLKYSCRNSNSDLHLHSEMVQKYKNKDCGTESAMTVFGANLMILFRGMHRSCIGRSALLCRQGKELSALVPQYLSNFSETVFSRFTSHFSRKCTAFTLAEVLITLGIIGIVAALTLPSLINEYKKKEVETRLAHTYSTMTQAFKLAEADNGESQYWTKNIAGSSNISDMSIVDDFLTAYFIPYLNFNTKIETIDGYGLKKLGYDVRYFNGYQMNEMRITRLNNGVILFWGMFIGRQGICALHIVLDINGTKGPNRIGSDLFDMTYSLYDGELFMSGEKNIDGDKLTYSKKQNYQQLLDNCKRTTTPDYFAPNYSCGAVIKLNGWKIPKDYPIKL